MTDVPVLNVDLASKIFNNSYLVEQIFSQIQNEVLKFIKLRGVNKQFNELFLRLVRRKHRKIDIEFQEMSDGLKGTVNRHVCINEKVRKLESEVLSYFGFLYDTAKVEVEEIRIKDLWKLPRDLSWQFHNAVISKLIGKNSNKLKVLIGLEESCYGCSDCWNLAKCCDEYGPIGVRSLLKMEEPVHFKKLIITDILFEVISILCLIDSTTENEFYEKMETIAKPSISCNTFVLWISETRSVGTEPVDHLPLPREVLEKMISDWNADSVQINFNYSFRTDYYQDRWSRCGFLTGIKLTDDSSNSLKRSKLNFKKVEVDLAYSFYCVRELRSNGSIEIRRRGYDKVISNIKILFPSDEISIKNASEFCGTGLVLETVKRFMEMGREEERPNLKLEMELFIRIDSLDELDFELNRRILNNESEWSLEGPLISIYRKEPYGEPEELIIDHKTLNWWGQRLEKRNTYTTGFVSLNIYLNYSTRDRKHPKEIFCNFLRQCSMLI